MRRALMLASVVLAYFALVSIGSPLPSGDSRAASPAVSPDITARVVSPDHATSTPTPSPSPSPSRIERRTFHSQLLGRDLPYTVFLPPGYDSSGAAYPVLYMLHGLSGTNQEWEWYGIFPAADKLMQGGETRPFIIVLPQGDTAYWVDHADGGPAWGRYMADEMVGEVDARYRTATSRDQRAIGGLSMGATGALQLALNYPEEFGIVGAHSPAFRKYETAPPIYGDRAFFAAHDAVNLAKNNPEIARSLRIWIDIGDADQWDANAVVFHQQLAAEGVDHQFNVWSGRHAGGYWTAHVRDYLLFYGSSFGPAPTGAQPSSERGRCGLIDRITCIPRRTGLARQLDLVAEPDGHDRRTVAEVLDVCDGAGAVAEVGNSPVWVTTDPVSDCARRG